jgi:hypothetical protein
MIQVLATLFLLEEAFHLALVLVLVELVVQVVELVEGIQDLSLVVLAQLVKVTLVEMDLL